MDPNPARRSRRRFLAFSLLLSALAPACKPTRDSNGDSNPTSQPNPPATSTSPHPPSQKPKILTSFFPLFDFTRHLAAQDFDVVCLTPPGADPHAMDATPEIARQVANAHSIIVLGLGMDPWLEKLATSQNRPLLIASHGLSPRKAEIPNLTGDSDSPSSTPPSPPEDDPHLWLDPILAQQLVEKIAAELIRVAPNSASQIQTRKIAYLTQLQQLDAEFSSTLSQLPRRDVVTFHGAFAYLFARYNLRTLGVIELFPGNEPSAAYLRQLVNLMRQHKLSVLFAEPQLPDRPAQILAREIQGRIERLDPCETILESAPNSTYLERQRANLATLQKALSER